MTCLVACMDSLEGSWSVLWSSRHSRASQGWERWARIFHLGWGGLRRCLVVAILLFLQLQASLRTFRSMQTGSFPLFLNERVIFNPLADSWLWTKWIDRRWLLIHLRTMQHMLMIRERNRKIKGHPYVHRRARSEDRWRIGYRKLHFHYHHSWCYHVTLEYFEHGRKKLLMMLTKQHQLHSSSHVNTIPFFCLMTWSYKCLFSYQSFR